MRKINLSKKELFTKYLKLLDTYEIKSFKLNITPIKDEVSPDLEKYLLSKGYLTFDEDRFAKQTWKHGNKRMFYKKLSNTSNSTSVYYRWDWGGYIPIRLGTRFFTHLHKYVTNLLVDFLDDYYLNYRSHIGFNEYLSKNIERMNTIDKQEIKKLLEESYRYFNVAKRQKNK